MKAKSYWLFFMLLLLAGCKTAKLSDAQEKQSIGEYYEAAGIYRKVYGKTSPRNRDLRGYIAYRMAECNRQINYTSRALSGYINALRYNYPDSIVHLRLAQMHQKSGRYADAITHYSEYLKSYPGSITAVNGITGSRYATDWRNNPTRYEVKRADSFNSRRGEFGPMLTGEAYDRLYFSSSRTKEQDAPSAVTGQHNNNLFVVNVDDKGRWLAPKELEDPVNTEADEGTPSFTTDGNTMYYTYCTRADDGHRTAEIYISSRSDAAWSKGRKVAIVNDSVTAVAHPAVSPDGQWLYYVSDAMGGYGGKDIFRSRLSGSEVGPMENLGPGINTPGNETFPCVRDSVTIYFASDGHPGMGGLDIFRATRNAAGTGWTVENMGWPVNSSADDFGITFAGRQERGFFSSNRNDARGYDHIYSFSLPVITVLIEGIVHDVDDVPIEGATVRIVGKDGLNEQAITRRDGDYRIELERDMSYVMMAGATGYLNQNFELKTDSAQKSEVYTVDFFLSPIYRPVVIENIFYDFDKATLRPESQKALDEMIKMLNDNPNVTIELSAHTDRKGDEEYNRALSLRRAQSVVSYLTAGGIAADRLQAKGYGESVPKEINKRMAAGFPFLAEGNVLTEAFILSLLPEQQEAADQINRRTEFKVLRTNYNLF